MTMISDNVWEYRDVVVVFEEGFCTEEDDRDEPDDVRDDPFLV